MMIDVRARAIGTRFQMKSFLISRWCENQTGSAARVPLPARPAAPAPARQPPPPRAAAPGRGGRGSGPWVPEPVRRSLRTHAVTAWRLRCRWRPWTRRVPLSPSHGRALGGSKLKASARGWHHHASGIKGGIQCMQSRPLNLKKDSTPLKKGICNLRRGLD